MSDSDDDQPQLSSSTLAALQEFLREKEEREDLLKRRAEEDQIPDTPFDENWVSKKKKYSGRFFLNSSS